MAEQKRTKKITLKRKPRTTNKTKTKKKTTKVVATPAVKQEKAAPATTKPAEKKTKPAVAKAKPVAKKEKKPAPAAVKPAEKKEKAVPAATKPAEKQEKVAPAKVVSVPVPVVAKKANTVTVSRPFYALVIAMIIILIAETIAGYAILFNYDVYFSCNKPIITHTHSHKERNVRRRDSSQKSGKKRRKDRAKSDVTKGSAKPVTVIPLDAAVKPKEPEIEIRKPIAQCPPRVERKVVFNEDEYKPYAQEGNAVIEGKLCAVLKDGSTKCFGNTNVFINPVTSYSDEWYRRAWAGKENLQIADDRAFKYNINVLTDKDGNFKFENLQPGAYYVGAAVNLPEGKEDKQCHYARFGTKVRTKNRVNVELKQLYP